MTLPDRKLFLGATLAGAAAGAAYARWVAPWQERWGATDEEVAAVLPGDTLVPEPAVQITRAITVEAPAARVWPWLAQLGADRGGFYSYDALENLFGLRIRSADEIVEEWQHLAPGDVVYATRSRGGGWYVADVQPEKLLVLRTADLARGRPVLRTDPVGWEFLWTFALVERGDGTTRLLVRERVAFRRTVTRLLMAPLGPVSFVMTRRMLLGIKARAERAPLQGRIQTGPRQPTPGQAAGR